MILLGYPSLWSVLVWIVYQWRLYWLLFLMISTGVVGTILFFVSVVNYYTGGLNLFTAIGVDIISAILILVLAVLWWIFALPFFLKQRRNAIAQHLTKILFWVQVASMILLALRLLGQPYEIHISSGWPVGEHFRTVNWHFGMIGLIIANVIFLTPTILISLFQDYTGQKWQRWLRLAIQGVLLILLWYWYNQAMLPQPSPCQIDTRWCV